MRQGGALPAGYILAKQTERERFLIIHSGFGAQLLPSRPTPPSKLMPPMAPMPTLPLLAPAVKPWVRSRRIWARANTALTTRDQSVPMDTLSRSNAVLAQTRGPSRPSTERAAA